VHKNKLSISILFAVTILLSFALISNAADDFVGPFFNFISQIPADADVFNVLGNPMNITYNITDPSGLNESTVTIYHKTNSSTSAIFNYINGTDFSGYMTTRISATNITDLWTFRISDGMVYPASYNFNETQMISIPHRDYTLSSGNNYVKIQMLNISNAKNFSFFEIMAKNLSGSTANLRVYYCNSSYTSGTVATSLNCVNFYNIPMGQYNHTHGDITGHMVAPFPINVASGKIGNVYVTSKSYFLVRGTTSATNNWNVSYITNISRPDAIQVTSNSGNEWANLSVTVDAHIHQYDGSEILYYYICAKDVYGNENCSTPIISDQLQFGSLPPTAPSVYSPIETRYAGLQSINYTASQSANNYQINNYNISLLYPNTTFFSTIKANNSGNLSLVWNTSVVNDGEYIIMVEACDSTGSCSSGYSENFTIDNTRPVFVGLTNTSVVFNQSFAYQVNATDAGGISCFTVNDTTNFNINCTGYLTNATNLTIGIYHLNLAVNDTVNNTNTAFMTVNVTNVTVITDTTSPSFATGNTRPVAGTTYNQSTTITLAVNPSESSTVIANISWDSTSQLFTLVYNGTQWYYNNTFASTSYPGNYIVTINATDATGNFNTTTTNFTITDSQAPAVTNIQPAAGTNYNFSQVINVTVNVTDYHYDLVDTVIAEINYPNGTKANYTLTEVANTQIFNNLLLTGTALGRHNITIIANDTYANVNQSITSYFNVNDISPPSITSASTTPALPTANNGSAQNITVTFTSSEYPVNVIFNLLHPNGTVASSQGPTTLINSSALPINYTIPSGLTDNTYTIRMIVNDSSNNANLTTLGSVTVDTTTPTVSLISPADNTSTTSTSQTFTFNVTDSNNIASCSLIFDGSSAATSTSITRNISQGISYSSISVGAHNWSIRCLDEANNPGASSIRYLNVTSSPSTGGGSGGGSTAQVDTQSLQEEIDTIESRNGNEFPPDYIEIDSTYITGLPHTTAITDNKGTGIDSVTVKTSKSLVGHIEIRAIPQQPPNCKIPDLGNEYVIYKILDIKHNIPETELKEVKLNIGVSRRWTENHKITKIIGVKCYPESKDLDTVKIKESGADSIYQVTSDGFSVWVIVGLKETKQEAVSQETPAPQETQEPTTPIQLLEPALSQEDGQLCTKYCCLSSICGSKIIVCWYWWAALALVFLSALIYIRHKKKKEKESRKNHIEIMIRGTHHEKKQNKHKVKVKLPRKHRP
jgi:hypothetical protein